MSTKTDLTFSAFTAANRERIPQFRNAKGEPAHSKPDGSDWNPAQWLQALVGELGEYARVRHLYETGKLTFEQYQAEARKELADVQTCLTILAMRASGSWKARSRTSCRPGVADPFA